jgi:hypothetical protein
MGCGCGGGRRTGPSRTPALRPASATTPRAVQTGLTSAASPAEIRALGLQQNTTPKSAIRMDAERRRIEKLKRDAIRAKGMQ